MPNLFSGVNLALQALLSQQQAIEVTEHNVANASTPGYHRQSAVLAAAPSYSPAGMAHGIGAGSFGSGVMVDQINRFTSEFYNTRYRQSAAEASQWDLQGQMLQQVESTLNETGPDNLISRMDEFWAGWRTLAGDPANLSLRTSLLDSAKALAGALNTRAAELTSLQNDQNLAVSQRVEEVNGIAQEIAHLNGEISRVLSTGDQPNDLLDQRDVLLDRLSELAGAQSFRQANGEVMVSIAGHSLVIGHDVTLLNPATPTDANNLIQLRWADGQPFVPATGELAGLLEGRNKVIPSQIAGLDTLASALAVEVNALHQGGSDLAGAAHLGGCDLTGVRGVAFFTGTTAMSLRVNPVLDDVRRIAAATSSQTLPGDGEIARQLADLQAKTAMNGSTTSLSGYYNQQISALGLAVRRAATNARDQGLTTSALDTQRESLSGVSLDEEAANLVKAQRAYQAATRLMTAIDEMMDRVINNMGLVGR